MPAVRCRYDGLAAAHSPNAPSTCTHASYRRATGIARAKSSNAPLCTSPAPRQTIAGPSPARQGGLERVDGDPALVVGVDLDDRLLAEAEVAHGAVDGVVAVPPHDDPHPRRLEQPALRRRPSRPGRARRAGRRTGTCSWPSSRRSRSRPPSRRAGRAPRPPNGRPTTSTAAAAGVSALMPAFWSQMEVSTSAPSAAGMDPPITKPKNRGPGRPGSPASAVAGQLLHARRRDRPPTRAAARRRRPASPRTSPAATPAASPSPARNSCASSSARDNTRPASSMA